MSIADGALNALREFLGPRAAAGQAVREHHSKDESYHTPYLPDLVVFPETTDEVSRILALSDCFGFPVVPFGAGTSLEGQVIPLEGGVSIDMTRMNRLLRVSPEDMDATVEAGMMRSQLAKQLERHGLTFFVDPGADTTIGGMTATRASGTTAVRYGTMRDNVLGLTVVLPDGRVVRTGGRARKSSAGYDLTGLFVGSEGTLGVITEVTLRLQPLPEAISAAVCAFDTIEGAANTVIRTRQYGIPVARIELLDALLMRAVNAYSQLAYEEVPTLFFEFHGTSESAVSEAATLVREIAIEHGGREFQWATTPEDRTRLWHARHHAFYAALALRPGAKAWTTDVCVPISQLARCITETCEDNATSFLTTPIVGHAGDGNFHVLYLLDPAHPEELQEATRLNDRLVSRALALGGTCTGEHGVGVGKMASIAVEHGEAIDVMWAIKRAIDPDNRMNPGKMLRPVEQATGPAVS